MKPTASGSVFRSSIGVVLAASALVVISCTGVEDTPVETQLRGTTSTPDTTSSTPQIPTAEPSDSTPDRVDPGVSLQWTEAELSDTTFVDHMLATEEGFVAYRFSHGPRAWTSPDGVRWTPRDLVVDAISDDPAVYSLTVGGDGYVAIGADPPTITSDDNRTVWISGDGFDWQRHDLVVENPSLDRFAEIILTTVVGGSDGRLVLVGRMGPQEGAVDEHDFVVWTSRDGLEWQLQPDPFDAGSYIDDRVYATPQGFITNGYVDGGGETAWWSVDGRQWEELSLGLTGEASSETAVIRGTTQRLVSWDDHILTVAGTNDGIGLWVSDDGLSWTPLASSPALHHTPDSIIRIDEIAAGRAGIVMIGQYESRPPEPQAASPVSVEVDGRVLTVDVETETLMVTDLGEGVVLLEIGIEEVESVLTTDDETLTVVDPETGEELISVSLEEWFRSFEEAGLFQPEIPGEQPTPMLWFSSDGETWTVVDMEETFGTDHTPTDIVVGGESVLIRWSGIELSDDGGGFSEDHDDPSDLIWVGTRVDSP